jgi:glyoxylase-like metal-dependent hydrolase (beta-lactamase superfamily II)
MTAPAQTTARAGPVLYPLPAEKPAFEEVAPGVLRLNTALPFRGLKQVNLWLLEDGDGWTMVDCGFGSGEVREHLSVVWDVALRGRPITRLIGTHFHPDHMGNCAWICNRWGLAPYMTTPEWMAAQLAARDLFTDDVPQSAEFFEQHGLAPDLLETYRSEFLLYSDFVQLPKSFHSIVDGEMLRIGSAEWQVIVGRGHSPALAGLYCAERRVYISGDQVLPKITSNISVVHWEPLADPLHQFLDSLRIVRSRVADDVLVLPSHKEPFCGLHKRLDELEEHHETRLELLRSVLRRKGTSSAAECMNALFGFELDGHQVFFAMGEALAHLNHLMGSGEAELYSDGAGKARYRWTGETASTGELHDDEVP